MNILNQMQQEAEKLIPGVNLAELLAKPPVRTRPLEQRKKIAVLLRSGSFYLDPTWLDYYYPISDTALNAIKYNPKIKTP